VKPLVQSDRAREARRKHHVQTYSKGLAPKLKTEGKTRGTGTTSPHSEREIFGLKSSSSELIRDRLEAKSTCTLHDVVFREETRSPAREETFPARRGIAEYWPSGHAAGEENTVPAAQKVPPPAASESIATTEEAPGDRG